MKLIYFILFYIVCISLHAQSSSKWIAFIGTSIEKSDLRVSLDSMYSISNINIGLSYISLETAKFKITNGIGIGMERDPKLQPVQIRYQEFNLRYNYYKYLISLPNNFSFQTYKNLSLGINITPRIGVYRFFKKKGRDIMSKNKISGLFYNNTEFSPFIAWAGDKWTYQLMVRAYNLKRVDEFLFYKDKYTDDTPIEDRVDLKTVDLNNPLKISINIGYRF